MRLRLGLCGLLLVAAAAGEVRAYPFDTKSEPAKPEPKSAGKALVWSAGLTALGALVFAGGMASDNEAAGVFVGTPILIFGPAIGRGYARGPILPGLLIRGVSGLAAMVVLKDNILQCTDECGGEDPRYLEGQPEVVFWSAATIMFASAVYDTVRAPLDAREYNSEHGFALAPTLMGDRGAGLALGGSF